jgi:hypothetical protein
VKLVLKAKMVSRETLAHRVSLVLTEPLGNKVKLVLKAKMVSRVLLDKEVRMELRVTLE